MGRVSNPGAPQRVSAHVLPKAPVVPREEEDEKTTIESGWEEEASTTVEQGDVADKIRSIGAGIEQARRTNTNITSTHGGSMPDEPTVDDQRGAAALARLPPPAVARLVITQGNDSGQSIEVRPGKTYTIGRGVDNDLVLTDIAVSRKHFDVRHERGSWVLADRGSGNGTLVNHRIEDAPFMLASGDVIEIGNTAFRFDLPNGVPRTQSSFVSPSVTQRRPKTLPPPVPLPLPRPRTQASRPPAGGALDRPDPQSQPQPLPPPSRAAALAPTMSPMHAMQAFRPPQPQATLPLLPRAQGLMVVASAQPGYDASATALVQPMSYSNGQPVRVPQPLYIATPPLSRRMKLGLGGAGLALFAAVATIAIVKGSTGGSSSGSTSGPGYAEAPSATLSRPVPPPKPTVVPIPDPETVESVAPTTADKTTTSPPAPVTPKVSKVEVARTDKKHGGRSTQDVKNDADALYRAKRFGDAAALVTAALSSVSGVDSQELKRIAAVYAQLGKAYNVGMAPGTKSTDAFVVLRRAISYDRSLGSAYVAEIEHVLVTVASKAALSYAAAKEYGAAFQAVRFAESLGSTSPTNRAVREKLEEVAGELYRSASSEMSTDPDGAKKKLRQILGMVDTKSPLYGKAAKLLTGS